MKKILTYLFDFIKKDFNSGYYLTIAVVLAAGIYINYTFGFKKEYLDSYYGTTEHFFRFLVYFSFIYFSILLIQAIWKNDYSAFRNRKYLLKISVGLLILAFDSSSRHIYSWIVEVFDVPWGLQRWVFYGFINLHQFVNLGIIIFILKWVFDRSSDSAYGLTLKDFDVKPYFLMLAVMLPLIAWASFQVDFLRSYPIYKDNFNIVAEHFEPWKAAASFEMSYALRFVGVEMFFRGFLIVGMIRLIGERALMPMVVLYSFWHFGKPMMETVGAAFGGYILGIIALRSGSIFGGIIVHIGVAMMMELGAWLQLFVIKD